MLKSPSSPTSNDGLDFDFFDSAKVTETGTSANVITTQAEEDVAIESEYTIEICGKQLRLARDPLVGTGGLLWPAGETLARYLCQHPALVHGQHVLELGSGTGVVGLSIAAHIPACASVTLTDLKTVLPVLQLNTRLNGLIERIAVQELAWGEPPFNAALSDADVFLLADCVYLESLFQPLVDSLLQLMIRNTQVAYLCYKKRRKADSRFFKLLRRHFILESIKIDDEAVWRNGIQLYKFTRKHCPSDAQHTE